MRPSAPGRVARHLASLPLVARFAVIGLASASMLGGVVGLVLGLIAYPATAWFAVFEVGIPAGVVGAVVGALVGIVVVIFRRVRRTLPR